MSDPDWPGFVVILATALPAALVAALVTWFAVRGGRSGGGYGNGGDTGPGGRTGAEVLVRLVEGTRALAAAQAELSGRLAQVADTQSAAQANLAERLQTQERALTRAVDDRLADLGNRLGAGLRNSTDRTVSTLNDLRERLAVIDAAQSRLTELSGRVAGLSEVLANRHARGLFGEVQLEALVKDALPPSAYRFQAPLSNGKRADCLLLLPEPPGVIAVDAKFPLDSYHALRAAGDDATRRTAARAFAAAIHGHVRDIADRYIVPGETADSALMFLPAEAVYAELFANHDDVVQKAYRARVWIVSPTTLMATLNTIQAVLRDARLREQAGLIRAEVQALMDDTRQLDDRMAKLGRHLEQAGEDLRQVRGLAERIARRGGRIGEADLDGTDGDTAGGGGTDGNEDGGDEDNRPMPLPASGPPSPAPLPAPLPAPVRAAPGSRHARSAIRPEGRAGPKRS